MAAGSSQRRYKIREIRSFREVKVQLTGANPRNYNSTVLDSKRYHAVNTIENKKMQETLIYTNLRQFLGEGRF